MKRYPGVVTGVVESLDDPRGEGRIQVSFPLLPDVREYPWAPVAAPLAGVRRGAFFMPEEKDEVLIAFENGVFDHPFIVGFLWNGVDRPPESDYKNRIILTPGGHTLRFEDGNNKKVIIKSSRGHEIVMDDGNDQKITIKSNSGHELVMDDSSAGQTVTLKTKSLQKIVMDDKDQSVEIQGGGRILAMRGGQFMIT